MLKINVGGIDRIVRVVAGVVLISLAAAGIVGTWGYIGIAPLLTGVFRFCPAYALGGFSSCEQQKH